MKPAPQVPSTLAARTVEVDAPADVLDHYVPGGFVFLDRGTAVVARGAAAVVAPAEVSTVLGGIAHDAPADAPAPLAIGSLPFSGAGTLTIPARTLRIDARGRAWQTDVGDATLEPVVVPDDDAARFVVQAHTTNAEWQLQVNDALDAIARGDVTKLVLAREVIIEADAPFAIHRILARLRASQGGCFVFGIDGFVGASPELLVRRTGALVESSPMAGTAARGGTQADDDAAVDALRHSEKNAREHRVVIDAVRAALAPHCRDLVVPDHPDVVRLATLSHLVTNVRGSLTSSATALDLACALHPTPAVNGTPTEAARSLIAQIEQFDRGPYAGPTGWVDATGDGTFVVALRCAQIHGAQAQLFAGAGIVAGSDPDSEWAETQTKLEPMLRALVRP
ncbi:MAG: isochorismate synthase [Acidimicrobiia bacterium]